MTPPQINERVIAYFDRRLKDNALLVLRLLIKHVNLDSYVVEDENGQYYTYKSLYPFIEGKVSPSTFRRMLRNLETVKFLVRVRPNGYWEQAYIYILNPHLFITNKPVD